MRARIAMTGAILAALGAASFVTAPGANAASQSLSGMFQIQFGGPHNWAGPGPGCDPNSFCGSGALAGYGTANVYLNGDSFGATGPDGCAPYTKSEDIVLPDNVSALTISSVGTACTPGASDAAPSSNKDYGHPATFETTYTVIEAHGAFATLVGTTGHETFKVAGSTGRWYFP